MKKSELKEYLKTEILGINEASQEDIKAQQDLDKALDSTQKKADDLKKASDDNPLAEKITKNKMKKSEFKEYLKTEILQMSEASKEDIDIQQDLNKELEITKKLTSTMEGKMKKSEFKEYLKTEILAEFNGNIDPGTEPKSFLKKKPDYVQLEEEEEIEDIEVDVTDDVEVEDEVVVEPTPDEATLDGMTDELVAIARRAKEAGFVELANQILNSAKFSSKTQFDAITPEV
jgi:hypothetical protein